VGVCTQALYVARGLTCWPLNAGSPAVHPNGQHRAVVTNADKCYKAL